MSNASAQTRPHQSEHAIQTDIRLAASTYPELVLWRNHTGVTQGEERVRRYGLCKGAADLVGILRIDRDTVCCEPGNADNPDGSERICLGHHRVTGRFVAFEIKTPVGRTTPEQDQFLAVVRKMGGFACVLRSVSDLHQAIARARAGASE